MSFRNLDLKKSYSSDIDVDILEDFYIPVLSEAIEYKRLAGFFSSNSLVVASKGILEFILNEGEMKMIISPKLREDDVQAILEGEKIAERLVEKSLIKELEKAQDLAQKPLEVLSWMVANKMLDFKIALIFNEDGNIMSGNKVDDIGLFHQKVGILRDEKQNIISFSGSINETASGWIKNIEEFKVFRSWNMSEDEYLKEDIDKFNRFWNGISAGNKNIETMNIPEAVKEKFIDTAPNDLDSVERVYEKYKKNRESFYNISSEKADNEPEKTKSEIELFDHQREAVEKWLDNGKKCLFEMATGTGKTFAALGCLKELNEDKLLTIITCPGNYLVQQWSEEIEEFGTKYDKKIIADSSNSNWKNQMKDKLVDLKIGTINRLIILTTHRTYSSNIFMSFIKEQINYFKVFLIADEVHGVGAEKAQLGLNDVYEYRLGLSATPERWLDFEGTDRIFEYFGEEKFEFGLSEAINRINPLTGKSYLTPYIYKPHFVTLSEEELQDYLELTESISRSYHVTSGEEDNEILQRLIFKRADIIKNAQAKLDLFNEIVNEDLEWTIVYCSPQQIDDVMAILSEDKGIVTHKFTQEEYIKPSKEFGGISERQYLIEKFAERKYQVLVAMKCLDEGVDIPPARRAFLLSNSGNPREYIQRIGRLIRRYPDKKEAIIHDIIVMPSYGAMPKKIRKIERKIFQKEKRRFEEIAKHAKNSGEALSKIYNKT